MKLSNDKKSILEKVNAVGVPHANLMDKARIVQRIAPYMADLRMIFECLEDQQIELVLAEYPGVRRIIQLANNNHPFSQVEGTSE